jgi:hypothetical protein
MGDEDDSGVIGWLTRGHRILWVLGAGLGIFWGGVGLLVWSWIGG